MSRAKLSRATTAARLYGSWCQAAMGAASSTAQVRRPMCVRSKSPQTRRNFVCGTRMFRLGSRSHRQRDIDDPPTPDTGTHRACTVSSKSAVSCIVVTRVLTTLPHDASNMLFCLLAFVARLAGWQGQSVCFITALALAPRGQLHASSTPFGGRVCP